MPLDSVGRIVSSPEDGGAGVNRPTLGNLAENVAQEITGRPAAPAAPPAPAPAQPVTPPVQSQPVVPKAGAVPTPPATPASQAARPSTPGAEATPVVSVEDAATTTRIRQELAKKDKLLRSLGIDPDGQDVDLAARGLIDVDTLVRRPVTMPAQPTPASPELPLSQRILNIQNRIKGDGDVSAENYRQTVGDLLGVITDLTQDINTTKEQERRRAIEEVQKTLVDAAGGTVDRSEKLRTYLPDDTIRGVVRNMVIGAADVGITQLANDRRIGARAFTQENYRQQGSDMVAQFEAILDAVYTAGQRSATEAIGQPRSPVVPAAAGGGQGPAAPPVKPMRLQDLDRNVNAFLAEQARNAGRPV